MNAVLLARVHRAPVAVLAILVLSASLLIAGLPRMMQAAYDDALGHLLDQTSATQTDLLIGRSPATTLDVLTEPAQFATANQTWWRLLPPELRAVTDQGPGSRAHYNAKTAGTPVAGLLGRRAMSGQFVNLGWLSDADRRVRFVRGTPPGPAGRISVPDHPDIPRLDIALVEQASKRMNLPIGTVLVLGHSNPVAARVTAIFEPLDATDRYWHHNEDMLNVSVRVKPSGDDETHITSLTSADSLLSLAGGARLLTYQWVIPVRSSAVNARNADSLIGSVARYIDRARIEGSVAGYAPQTGLTTLLSGFLDRLRAAETLLVLLFGGLLAVSLGVIALAVQLVGERTHHALSLMRARGGSLGQLVGTGVGLVALVTVPAVLLGYGAAFLVPGPVTPIVHVGPLVIGLTAIVFCAAQVAASHRRPLRDRRDDMIARRPSIRRLTLEVIVVVVALVGAYLLRNRGLTTSEPDPFLMMVPVALTVAAALITVRCYPYPLRLIVALVTRRRTAVPFLGFALAARARAFSALPVLILLPALAVSVFAAVISSGLNATQSDVAWQRTGADARIESTVEISPEAIERVRRVPGVTAVVPASKSPVQVGRGGTVGTGLAVDLAAYRAILAGTPLSVPEPPTSATASEVPALVSPELIGNATLLVGWQKQMTVVPKGIVAAMPVLGRELRNVVVVPFDANERVGARTTVNTLFIKGTGLDGRRLSEAAALAVTPVSVTVEEELDRITATPLAGTVQWTLLVVTAALTAYALLAVLIMLVIGAAERGTALSFLRTLGMPERQARGLTVLEIAPMIVLTTLAGLLLGLVLPVALGPGIDLSVYAGDLPVKDYPIDLITPALLAGGVAVVAVLGAFAHAAVSHRRALGSVLRVGES
ncbi:FtsX-like permease family protein [Streptosporangium soli]|nr:hypothetical protein [Streptosporangium sp. KLBMP 9127]